MGPDAWLSPGGSRALAGLLSDAALAPASCELRQGPSLRNLGTTASEPALRQTRVVRVSPRRRPPVAKPLPASFQEPGRVVTDCLAALPGVPPRMSTPDKAKTCGEPAREPAGGCARREAAFCRSEGRAGPCG